MTGCFWNHCIDRYEWFLPKKLRFIAQIIHCEQPARIIWVPSVTLQKTFHWENCYIVSLSAFPSLRGDGGPRPKLWTEHYTHINRNFPPAQLHLHKLQTCTLKKPNERQNWSTAMWPDYFFSYFGSSSDQIIKAGLWQEGNPGRLGDLLITGSQIMILIMLSTWRLADLAWKCQIYLHVHAARRHWDAG